MDFKTAENTIYQDLIKILDRQKVFVCKVTWNEFIVLEKTYRKQEIGNVFTEVYSPILKLKEWKFDLEMKSHKILLWKDINHLFHSRWTLYSIKYFIVDGRTNFNIRFYTFFNKTFLKKRGKRLLIQSHDNISKFYMIYSSSIIDSKFLFLWTNTFHIVFSFMF